MDTNLLELNYEVIIIFGVFPALISLFFLAVAVCCAPYFAWIFYQNRQDELYEMNSTRRMVSSLFRIKYDANVFQSQKSCMICLIDFDNEALVTPLPCDIRHYYHTRCIEEWLLQNARCPLCKAEVTHDEIDRVAQVYKAKLIEHAGCCSE